MEKLSKELSYQLLAWGIIDHDDIPIYQYGILNGMIIIINLLTAVVIGFFTGSIVEILVFLAAFISLRSFTGGVHLDSKLLCYIGSSLILLIPAYMDELGMIISDSIGGLANPVGWLLLVIAIVTILCLMPMDSKKRKLDRAEKRRFRFVGLSILGMQLLIMVILSVMDLYHYCYIIGVSIIIVAVLIIIGKKVFR